MKDIAKELREQGLTYAQIGEIVGKSKSTVFRLLNPKSAEKYRERWRDKYHRDISFRSSCHSSVKSYRSTKDGKEKKKTLDREYRENNQSKIQKWKRDNPDYHIRQRYNLAQEQFESMLHVQSNLCLICQQKMTRKPRCGNTINVDHCHATGKVRGLLCSNCNKALGLFKDNIHALSRAIEYLT